VGEVVRLFGCQGVKENRRFFGFSLYLRLLDAAAAEVARASAGGAYTTQPIERFLWLVGDPDEVPMAYAGSAAMELDDFRRALRKEGRVEGHLLTRLGAAARRLTAVLDEHRAAARGGSAA
jgi:hypothetical protein